MKGSNDPKKRKRQKTKKRRSRKRREGGESGTFIAFSTHAGKGYSALKGKRGGGGEQVP